MRRGREWGRRVSAHWQERFDGARSRWPQVERATLAVERYRHSSAHYDALVVLYRALFLSVCVMLALLYVLALVTSVLPGANEVSIPFVELPAEDDLGATVQSTVTHSQGAVLGVLGAATLVSSAMYTAKALRDGTHRILDPISGRRARLAHPRNLVLGLGLALGTLATWLLALATTVRTTVIVRMTETNIPRPLVNVGKWLLVAACVAILWAAMAITLRRLAPTTPTRDRRLAALGLAAFVVGANFFLLYSFVLALLDTDTSSGVVLVLTLLAWVNVVVRAYFIALCWLVARPETPGTQPASVAT